MCTSNEIAYNLQSYQLIYIGYYFGLRSSHPLLICKVIFLSHSHITLPANIPPPKKSKTKVLKRQFLNL